MTGESRRGRAAYAPTDEQRRDVVDGLARGESSATLAARLNISAPTFRRAFAEQIAAADAARAASASDPATLPLMAAPVASDASPSSAARPEAKRRGRPRYEATREDRDRVSLALATGWTQKDIAAVLDISEPTFVRVFREEIRIGALRKEMEVLTSLRRASNRGNVAAQKELLARFDAAKLERLGETMRAAPEPSRAKAETTGKKFLAAQAASEVIRDSDWSDLLKPGAEAAGNA